MRLRRRSTGDVADAVEHDDNESRDRDCEVDDLEQMDDHHAKAFFRRNTTDVIQRMRHPSDPADNIAARIVAQYAIDPRLRGEARRAIDDARTAREARTALENALDGYGQTTASRLRATPKA